MSDARDGTIRLGLISDTHAPERCASLPAAIFEVLAGVDLVLHAGDVGELWVLDQLSRIAPIVAVHGNDETAEARRELPYQQVVAIAGQRLLLCHSRQPDREAERASRRDDAWMPKLVRRADQARRAGATIYVYGHTHIPMARTVDGMLLVNPGAIASPGPITRQARQSVAVLTLRRDEPPEITHTDLAAPARSYVPTIAWEDGFGAALGAVSSSILTPDLAAAWPQLLQLVQGDAYEPGKRAILQLAHLRWAGNPRPITRGELLAAFAVEPELPADVHSQLAAILSPLST